MTELYDRRAVISFALEDYLKSLKKVPTHALNSNDRSFIKFVEKLTKEYTGENPF